MNDNKTLITHMQTDPNAPKHAILGAISTVMCMIIFVFYNLSLIWISLIVPFIFGILIEIYQRFTGGTNTNRESFFDILTTGLWYLIPLSWKR